MAQTRLKLTESQNQTIAIDTTMSLVSSSLSSLLTITFDNAFAAKPYVLNAYISEDAKSRGVDMKVDSVSASAIALRLTCDATPSDDTIDVVAIVQGKF